MKTSMQNEMCLPVTLGRTENDEMFVLDLAKAPHVLIGGAAGTGKTVAIHNMVASLLRTKSPEEVKFILIDPKYAEYAVFNNIRRQYLAVMREHEDESAVITTYEQTFNMLNSLIIEIQTRKELFAEKGCRDIHSYNAQLDDSREILPHIIVVMDEFGEFILKGKKRFEKHILPLLQDGEYVGVHFILATQWPWFNVITGVIKANMVTRLGFRMVAEIDSRNLLDSSGAESLNGQGDMIYSTIWSDNIHIQGAYIGETEINNLVNHIASQDYSGKQYTLPFCEVKDI